MKETNQTKTAWSFPEVNVTHVEVEGPVSASATPGVTNPEWIIDDSRADYDGDIWFPQ